MRIAARAAGAVSARPAARARPRRMRAGQARHLARRRGRHAGRPGGRPEDLSADDPARRPRGHPHLRRRPGRRLHAAGARRARRPMRARDLLRDRPQGRGAARISRGARSPEGHTVAHHTFTHPQPTLRYMSAAQARADILQGHGRGRARGLWRAISATASRRIFADSSCTRRSSASPASPTRADLATGSPPTMSAIFGVDLWASDWVRMTPEQELKLILGRLEKPSAACCCSTTSIPGPRRCCRCSCAN